MAAVDPHLAGANGAGFIVKDAQLCHAAKLGLGGVVSRGVSWPASALSAEFS
jgi:hypothetical protein